MERYCAVFFHQKVMSKADKVRDFIAAEGFICSYATRRMYGVEMRNSDPLSRRGYMEVDDHMDDFSDQVESIMVMIFAEDANSEADGLKAAKAHFLAVSGNSQCDSHDSVSRPFRAYSEDPDQRPVGAGIKFNDSTYFVAYLGPDLPRVHPRWAPHSCLSFVPVDMVKRVLSSTEGVRISERAIALHALSQFDEFANIDPDTIPDESVAEMLDVRLKIGNQVRDQIWRHMWWDINESDDTTPSIQNDRFERIKGLPEGVKQEILKAIEPILRRDGTYLSEIISRQNNFNGWTFVLNLFDSSKGIYPSITKYCP